MKMRLHLEVEKEGLVILESEPQLRNLFVQSQICNRMQVPLPYMLFVIRYVKCKNGDFAYPGLYGLGLHLFGKLTTLTDFSDEVFYLPTDRGAVCTNHDSDNKRFSSVVELVNHVISLWWGHTHFVDYQPFDGPWYQATLDDLACGDWENAGRFVSSRQMKELFSRHEEIKILADTQVLDVEWPDPLLAAKAKESRDKEARESRAKAEESRDKISSLSRQK